MTKDFVYFDHAATTPTDKRVLKKMLPYFDADFANPSSLYLPALKAKKAVDGSRAQIAKFLNCKPSEIIFTAGGTESDNLAVLGTARSLKLKGERVKGHIITTQIEHPAVLNACRQLKKENFDVTYLPVDRDGIVKLDGLKKALRKDTVLVSIMYANNEIGTIQPIAEISKILAKRKILFHSDACQAAGYLPMDAKKLGVDLLTINGSKIYGPKGIGVLYIKKGVEIEPITFGGGQENGLRSGTENVPAIVGLAAAISLLRGKGKGESEKKLRDYIIQELLKIPNSKLNGHRTKRLPNNINISFEGVEGESLVLYLDKEKIYTSTGSACSSTSLDPSHVIMAITNDAERAHSSLRVTLGRSTTKKDADKLISATKKYVKKLREMSAVK
ncbi:MAG: cysteine desulfurase [Candidatus Berkelbacteria bacterium]|nr:cysteine desulfurase [Candidatus Berkelbacteria bacterium]